MAESSRSVRPAEPTPVACETFYTTLGEGLKQYDAPPLTYGKTKAYGEFKHTQVTAFRDVHVGVSCLNEHLDTFQSMPESRDALASLHTGLIAGAALHAFGMDWKAALRCHDCAMIAAQTATEIERRSRRPQRATPKFEQLYALRHAL